MAKAKPKTDKDIIEAMDRIYARFHKKMLGLKQEQDRIIRRELARLEAERIIQLKARIAT